MLIHEIIHYILQAGIIGILVLVIRGQRVLLCVWRDLDKLKEQRISESDKMRKSYQQFFEDLPGLLKQYKAAVSQMRDEHTAKLEKEIEQLKEETDQKNKELSVLAEKKLTEAPEVRNAVIKAMDPVVAILRAATLHDMAHASRMTPLESQLVLKHKGLLIDDDPLGLEFHEP